MKKVFNFFIICAVALFTACNQTDSNNPEDPTDPNNPENSTDTNDPEQNNVGKKVAVDLGLSVKWATCNIGASKPSEYGNYFAWGEVSSKTNYSPNTYKWYKKTSNRYDGTTYSYTKYCTNSDEGTVDGKTKLELTDDAAHVNWGDNWRMPTLEEIEELESECIWQMVFNNNVKGWLITGPSGKNIFMPSAGYYDNSSLESRGLSVGFWSNEIESSYNDYAYCFYFQYNNLRDGVIYDYRYIGLPIRPVCPKN